MSEVVQRDISEARRIAHEMGLIAFFPHDRELFLGMFTFSPESGFKVGLPSKHSKLPGIRYGGGDDAA